MADQNTPTGGAAPAAPVTPLPPLPSVAERLTVPASALGLETELPEHLQIPAAPDTNNIFPAGPTGPAATAPAVTPAATGPAPTGPAAPATGATAPAVAPTATGPAATGPAPENKVKIGDKEYTTKELEKILADRAQQNQQPPAQPAQQPTPPPAPTAEQIAAAEATWCENLVKQENLAFPATEAEMETLLGGGKDAVAFFGKKLTEVAAKAVLLARKSIYADLNPQMEAFAARIEPLFQNHAQVERVSTEQAFLRMYPEYQLNPKHIETARGVAEAIIERYPQHVQRMTPQQFLETVNEQADRILQGEYKSWFPNATDTWRDAAKRSTTPAPQPAATGPAAPTAQPAAVAATAPAAPDPWKQPPAANSPASIPVTAAGDWNKSVAHSLRD